MDMPLAERPRERFASGKDVSAQELLAIVLGRGGRGLSVLTLAQHLLARFGSLEGVVNASLQDLQQINGLGPAKALQLKACLEIARRIIGEENKKESDRRESNSFIQPEDIAHHIRSRVRDWNKEHFFVVSFDNRNRLIDVDSVGVGTISASLVHPRETFDIAIRRHAAVIAICHNHPSGDPQPSDADLLVTKRLVEAGELMGISVVDHIIITKATLYSFRMNKGI